MKIKYIEGNINIHKKDKQYNLIDGNIYEVQLICKKGFIVINELGLMEYVPKYKVEVLK